ncbi:MAG: TolC family protein [Bacteroidetes bacterium]|nr:TolC family protein [Bacteroidota bacterium]
MNEAPTPRIDMCDAMRTFLKSSGLPIAVFVLLLPIVSTVSAQDSQDATVQSAQSVQVVQSVQSGMDVVLTLEEALQIALTQNLALENIRLDVKNGTAQVREGWAELFPQVDLSSNYTRNVRAANPFAGSQAGGLFQSLGFLDWLAFNEGARTDSDVGTQPISINEFYLRQAQGLSDAGIQLESSDNPFAVPSVYFTGIAINQKLFDGRVLFGAYGASKWLRPFNEEGLRRQEQVLLRDVKSAWYAVLLAEEQVDVTSQSVERSRRTLNEVSKQVSQGTAPKFQRLSAEVEVSNLETVLVQTELAAANALDNLKLLLGFPAENTISLRGNLESDLRNEYVTSEAESVTAVALSRRPDLAQARIGVELESIQLQVARSAYLPNIDAFANFNWLGNVPDNRVSYSSINGDPFSFQKTDRGYLDSAYWDRSVSVGLRLTWNVFDGFATHQRIQQRKIAMQKAENDVEFLARAIQVEIDGSLRTLRAAHRRLESQRLNLDRAELNYTYAEARLREGVATPLEVREASDQLDQTRFNFLQAVHDVLVAQSTYETAIGKPVAPSTSN